MRRQHVSTSLLLGLLGFGLWLAAAVFILPVAAAVLVLFLAYRLIHFWRQLPSVRHARNRHQAGILYQKVCALQAEAGAPTIEQFQRETMERLRQLGSSPPPTIAAAMSHAVGLLYQAEGFAAVAPPPEADTSEFEAARYRDRLIGQIGRLADGGALNIARDAVVGAFYEICKALPPGFDRANDAVINDSSSQFTVPLIDLISNVPKLVETLCAAFRTAQVRDLGLFKDLRAQLDENQCAISNVPYALEYLGSKDLVDPTEHRGSPEEIVRGYLRQTPLERLFLAHVPFELPPATRFEHHWLLGGSGHGKSQAMQYLIAHDLERVAVGMASIIVIDSQGDLLRNIAGLKLFAEGQPLHNKLCLIDPTDIEYPVSLNLFDVGQDRINGYSELDRERLMNGVLELYDFVLSSLLSAELTQKQSVIFRYITRLMLQIPGATIHTLRELMDPKCYEKYRSYIETLEGTPRAFFQTEFNSKQFEDTKRQVLRRLWGILENRTFERMFSHRRNKLDLFAEMNAGKVILINTAKELLKQNGTEIFGRFFIALIAQAAQERATLPQNARMPTFVYIDECADYLDHNVSLILEQTRKFKVGLILAHQYIGQLTPKMHDSFAANTSIKFAGGGGDKDARALAHQMRRPPEFIDGQPKGHFAAHVRNLTYQAVSLRVPFGHMEKMAKMSLEEYAQVRSRMRQRYAAHWQDADTVSGAGYPFGQRPEPMVPDASPSSEW